MSQRKFNVNILCDLLPEFPDRLKFSLINDLKDIYDRFFSLLVYEEKQIFNERERYILCDLLREFPHRLENSLTRDLNNIYEKFFNLLNSEEKQIIKNHEKILLKETIGEQLVDIESHLRICSLSGNIEDKFKHDFGFMGKEFVDNKIKQYKENIESLKILHLELIFELQDQE